MSKMSYRRFENTLADLEDCQDNFDNINSVEEAQAACDLYRLCATISRTYDLSDLEDRLAKLQAEDIFLAELQGEDEDE